MFKELSKKLVLAMLAVFALSSVVACNQVDSTADKTSALEDAPKGDAPKGCALEQFKNDKLCQLVPVRMEGEITLGIFSVKGVVENKFNAQGLVEGSVLFPPDKPNLPLLKTETQYDDAGLVKSRMIFSDMDSDGVFEIVDNMHHINYNSQGEVLREDITRSFGNNAPSKNIVKEYFGPYVISAWAQVDQNGNIIQSGRYENSFVTTQIDGSLILGTVEETNKKIVDDRLESTVNRFTNCPVSGSCNPQDPLHPLSASRVTTSLDYEGGEDVATTLTQIDPEGDGLLTGPFDNQISCRVNYQSGFALLGDDLKKVGFNNRAPDFFQCLDKAGTESEFRIKWIPLHEALGISAPGGNQAPSSK